MNDLAPHVAVIQIQWSTHEVQPDGKYDPHAKDNGHFLFTIQGQDRALANEYLNTLLDIIKGKAKNVDTIEVNEARLGESRLQGPGQPRNPSPDLLGMRGPLGRNHGGQSRSR